uniref:EF-hand domain-containing protein n=1 Tax=Strigamia maritima TaxID=126957 RepID=T1IZI6_STRMM
MTTFTSSFFVPTQMYILVLFAVFLLQTEAQFFAKTSKNLPRIGRRVDHQQEVSEIIPPSFKHLLAFVRKFDSDANGCLSPEELIEIPLFQMAFENEDFTPLEIAADVVEEYKSEVEGNLKDIVAKVLAASYAEKK